ncbi:MAG: hypothetical protein JO146_09330 [Candidatus Eremiobacteraeota bacterium]|nr:hypothetical protein [Candidatus Eremiobacteraeota bacterium]
MAPYYPWLGIFFLGCYHGLNPAMGWLFAVAIGLQERSSAAVLRSIVPLTLGHIASVGAVVLVTVVAAAHLPHSAVRVGGAAILLVFGILRLVRARHPRWVGMRVGFWGLALWSLLMSSAHGAGLMLVPFVTAVHGAVDAMGMPMPAPPPRYGAGLEMVALHTLGYAIATLTIAMVVYARFGVSFLRTAWFNVDLIWAAALIVSGLVTLLI